MNSGERDLCGLSTWHPRWLQKYANSKVFIVIYGLLGTIQATSYLYFVVTLTTIEKRFKIPSQTTGIILSGNEISQILLSLILSYAGGKQNRPRWIAWGMVFCALSCFILALPHFIYGPGEDALSLTKEYVEHLPQNGNFSYLNSTMHVGGKSTNRLCSESVPEDECEELVTIVPLILIFISQFILGIGNTLYYSLGQTYLDDNTKKTNSPMMFAYAISLRMLGPVFGFILGYISLNMFIDPSKTPLINRKDPRWLGAWWFGWTLLGTIMFLFSGLIGLFPKTLPRRKDSKLEHTSFRREFSEDSINSLDLRKGLSDITNVKSSHIKDFTKALIRLLKNKLLIFNIFSTIFYILGAGGYMTFLSKYMEVQFHKTAHNATIIIGPVTIIAMVSAFLISGLVISKKRPSPRKILMWNVIIGICYMIGQISYIFTYCGDIGPSMSAQKSIFNTSLNCNEMCSCDGVAYSPVCHGTTRMTFFSPCHAGCRSWDAKENIYSACSCIADQNIKSQSLANESTLAIITTSEGPNSMDYTTMTPGACLENCTLAFYAFAAISILINWLGSSGRIGNLLVNYRAVAVKDKSFAQGLALMLISLFALIPAPIIYGRLIDGTCLVWTEKCGHRGHCQFYDQTKFRYHINITALGLTFIGVFFDVLVWYYGRDLDLYDDIHYRHSKDKQKTKKSNYPLLTKK